MPDFSSDTLQSARQAGYSDDQIYDYWSQKDPRFDTARQSGYKLDDVASHLSAQNAPSLPTQVVTPDQPKMSLGEMLFGQPTAQKPSGYVGRGEFATESGAQSAPIVEDQPQDTLAKIARGVTGAIGSMIPTSLGDILGMTTLPRPSDVDEQMRQSEELGAAWRGERGLEEQAKAITGSALQAAPLLHLPFSESPLKPTPRDLALVKSLRQQQQTGGIENAQQINETTRPNGDVQLPGGEIPRETDGGQVPTAISGEGVQAGGQGETLQTQQEQVAPVETLRTRVARQKVDYGKRTLEKKFGDSYDYDNEDDLAFDRGGIGDDTITKSEAKAKYGRDFEAGERVVSGVAKDGKTIFVDKIVADDKLVGGGDAKLARNLRNVGTSDAAPTVQPEGAANQPTPTAETPTTVGETTATRQAAPVAGDVWYQGVGPGGSTTWVTSNLEKAKIYAARRGEGGRINVYTPDQVGETAFADQEGNLVSPQEYAKNHSEDTTLQVPPQAEGQPLPKPIQTLDANGKPVPVSEGGAGTQALISKEGEKPVSETTTGGQVESDAISRIVNHANTQPRELRIAIDNKTGEVLAENEGTQLPKEWDKPTEEAGWGPNDEPWRKVGRAESITDMHSHPEAVGPSDGDWGVFANNNVRKMIVAEKGGKLWTIEKTPKWDETNWQERTPRKLRDTYNKFVDAIEGEALTSKSTEEHIADVNRKMAEKFGVKLSESSHKDTGAPPVTEAPATAAPPEPPDSEGEGRTTGIAQRITNVPANEGLTVQESVDRGQNLLSEGVDPEEVSARVKTTKQLSVDDLSVLRARTSELDKAAYAAEDAMRANPKDPVARQAWEDAVKARNDWNTDHVKPAQTIWSDLGRTQQGEADIDTGTVTGLRVAFNEAKGRDPTPVEQAKLTDYADKTKNVEGRIDEAKSKYDQAIGKESGAGGVPTTEALQEHFLSKITDPNAKSFPFTQGEISDLWKYTKANYIDKGITSLDDTIHMVSLDTGLRPEWVADALTKPKAIKSVTNELYSAMSKRRDIVNAAKDYIRAKDEPLWKKVARGTWETPFSVAIWGHGTVGGITHAGANIFRPSVWKAYWPDFVNQAKFFVKPSIHEAAIQRLVRDPNFITAKRAGLANDPNLTYTDYGAYAKFFGLKGGRRGFDALKTMRQSMFNSMWEKVPDSIKSDSQASKEMAKGYAEMVNHATGVISNTDRGFLGTSSRALSPVMFAAKLEASRWARVVGDPLKTLDTYAQWNKATPAEKAVAIKRTKNAAEFTAAFLGTLYLNQQILSSSGSKDKINFSDPSKSDWLKHKIAGHTVAVDGGLLSPIRLLGRLTYDTLIRPRKELLGDTRTAAAIKDVGQYAIGKASPSVSIAKEALTAESFDGRLLPWSRDTSKKPRMTWPEYASSHGPIPISGGIKDAYDSMRQRGMSKPDTEAVLRGLAAFGSELTGARVMEIQEPTPKSSRNR